MKSISKFFSYCLSTSLLGFSGANVSACNFCNGSTHRTYRTLKLPCGCLNHADCILHTTLSNADSPTATCLECGKTCDVKQFWKTVWQQLDTDPNYCLQHEWYFPKCGHKTHSEVADACFHWIQNKPHASGYSSFNFVEALGAYNNYRMCGICGIFN